MGGSTATADGQVERARMRRQDKHVGSSATQENRPRTRLVAFSGVNSRPQSVLQNLGPTRCVFNEAREAGVCTLALSQLAQRRTGLLMLLARSHERAASLLRPWCPVATASSLSRILPPRASQGSLRTTLLRQRRPLDHTRRSCVSVRCESTAREILVGKFCTGMFLCRPSHHPKPEQHYLYLAGWNRLVPHLLLPEASPIRLADER